MAKIKGGAGTKDGEPTGITKNPDMLGRMGFNGAYGKDNTSSSSDYGKKKDERKDFNW